MTSGEILFQIQHKSFLPSVFSELTPRHIIFTFQNVQTNHAETRTLDKSNFFSKCNTCEDDLC